MEKREKIAILGASRGLGACFGRSLAKRFAGDFLLMARKEALLKEVRKDIRKQRPDTTVEILAVDFSKELEQQSAMRCIGEFSPTRIIYLAGGGPYGLFEEKGWKDHIWSLQVTFLFPARLIHFILSEAKGFIPQVTLVGSAIAEQAGDPKAASYSAGKHALLGLYRSIRAEKPDFDIRVFSPGYMDTELLPMNAWPRQNGALLFSPDEVSEDLSEWIFSEEFAGHRVFEGV